MRICVLFMLSMRVNKNFHMYSTLLLDIKIGEEVSTHICFVKMGSLEAAEIRGVHEFVLSVRVSYLIWVKFGIGYLRVTMSICEFHENRCRKSCTFLSVPTRSHVHRQTLWHFESKERLDYVRILRHCVHPLQSCHFVSTSTLALQTSYTAYTRCYVSRFKRSEREVGHLLLHLHSTMSNPKENYLLLQHALHYFTLLAICLWLFAAIYLFMAYLSPAFCFFCLLL